MYYRNADAILLVFDVTNKDSVTRVTSWLTELDQQVGDASQISLLVGNKSDLRYKRAISYSKAADMARSLGLDYIETSALEGSSVEEAFLRALERGYALAKDRTLRGAVSHHSSRSLSPTSPASVRRRNASGVRLADSDETRANRLCCSG